MTQEDKQLIFKDLCARLPYGAKYQDRIEGGIHILSLGTIHHYERFIPYLRPMSSMTEDELDACVLQSGIKDVPCPNWQDIPKEEQFRVRLNHAINVFLTDASSTDWLNAHYFDYRGLIEKGLALEAPEGMYKTE